MLQELKSKLKTPETTSGRYRWVVCGLLFFATTVNYMDRQILSLLKPILDNQLHWSNEEFGGGEFRLPRCLRHWRINLRIFGRSSRNQNRLRHFDYGLESRGDGTCLGNQRRRIFRC